MTSVVLMTPFYFDYRNIPRALVISMVIVAVVYLLVNVALFVSLSYEEVASAETVALVRGWGVSE